MRLIAYPRLFAAFRSLGHKFWLTFFLACGLAIGAEVLIEKLLHSTHDPGFAASIVTATGLYQRIVTKPRHPVIKYTTIVEINSELDIPTISSSNVCAQRAFLARLLWRISDASPSMIVIDKYFGRDSCSLDDDGTRALVRAVQEIRRRHPLVVGVRVKELRSGQRGASYIEPSLDFGKTAPPPQEGILNIARDNRKLPLQWRVYSSAEEATSSAPITRDTLALTVAKLHDPKLFLKYPKLEQMLAHGAQPFIGFLRPEAFGLSHMYASEVLCGQRLAKDEKWQDCEKTKTDPGILRNRIVLIGENDGDRDQHVSILGRIAGLYLQGNYIEALLDDRYYAAGGAVLDYGFAFLFLLCLELILIVCHGQIVRAIIMIVGLLTLTCLILYLILMFLHVYIDPLPVSLTGVVIKILHLASAYAQRAVLPGRTH